MAYKRYWCPDGCGKSCYLRKIYRGMKNGVTTWENYFVCTRCDKEYKKE